MTVPHVGHLPLMARRPFFITSSIASTISFLALHLTQYPSGIREFLPRRVMRQSGIANTLRFGPPQRQLVKGHPSKHAWLLIVTLFLAITCDISLFLNLSLHSPV